MAQSVYVEQTLVAYMALVLYRGKNTKSSSGNRDNVCRRDYSDPDCNYVHYIINLAYSALRNIRGIAFA
jgi:hypothetical protein